MKSSNQIPFGQRSLFTDNSEKRSVKEWKEHFNIFSWDINEDEYERVYTIEEFEDQVYPNISYAIRSDIIVKNRSDEP